MTVKASVQRRRDRSFRECAAPFLPGDSRSERRYQNEDPGSIEAAGVLVKVLPASEAAVLLISLML